MSQPFTIAIAQLNFLVGDIEGNADRIIQATAKITVHESADLIIFPELALCGYPPEDLLFRPEFYKRCNLALTKIQENIEKTAIILGYPEKEGDYIYNKAACIQNKKIIAHYRKQELPNYAVFDEKRYFTAGNTPCVFELNGLKIALIICEDAWHPTPIAQAKKAGAEFIVSINASPFDIHQAHDREIILKQRTSESHLPLIYCNLIGGQDELVFDGGSMVVDAKGDICQKAAFFKEDYLMVRAHIVNHTLQLPRAISSPAPIIEKQMYDALTLGVRDYIVKNHFRSAIIGLSGGIDSALTLAIAADAIGADKVTAVIMPSRYTQSMSVEDAINEARALDVQYHVIEIDALQNSFLTALNPLFLNTSPDVTEENLQARIRGMLLMALSNKFGHLVLTTGNKSEMAVGYATLYGDMAGGLSVIKDVPKTMVYKLAQYRNLKSHVIPERVLTRAPSAELKPNQTDQDRLPPYDVLDEIIERYIEKDEDAAQIIQAGFTKHIVDDVINMINKNEYKRRQAPIGIRLSRRAFGRDRRYPVTSGFVG